MTQAPIVVAPWSVAVAHRDRPLGVRITTPRDAADRQAAVLFSHGDGLTAEAYAPLAEGWARHGLSVLQPDHAATPDEAASKEEPWLLRLLDLRAIAERCAGIDRPLALPQASGLLVAGHSLGAHSVSLLLGAWPAGLARLPWPAAVRPLAGVLLAPPGDGRPPNLAAAWQDKATYLSLDWSGAVAPFLVLIGANDPPVMALRDWRWRMDAFALSPSGNKTLLLAATADHYFGGLVPGRGVVDPALLAQTVGVTARYLLDAAAAPGTSPELAVSSAFEVRRR